MTDAWANFVILDDEQKDAQQIAAYLQAIFAEAGLTIHPAIVRNSNEATKALDAHPDFFVCDVSLGKLGEAAGLDLIENLKPRFPHVNFVAVTMQFKELSSGLSYIVAQPDFVLSKAKILSVRSKEFDDYLLGYFILNRRQNRRLTVKREAEVERICKHALAWGRFDGPLFDCLIRQVFKTFDLRLDATQFYAPEDEGKPRRHKVTPREFINEIVDYVKVSPLDQQGQSGSAVFKAETRFKGAAYKVALILKFCRIDAFLKEVGNFSRYVKWMLPYSWRVDILGEGISEHVGLIAYSLAMDGASSAAQPLSNYIAAGNRGPVEAFIDQVFSATNRTWYAAVETAIGRSLIQDLLSRYFARQNELIKHVNSLKEKLQSSTVFSQIYRDKPFDAVEEFISRVRQLTLESRELLDYQTCICHGDLHSGNIMVAGRSTATGELANWQFAFIDFQDTGRLHIATDFVVFENAIRKDSAFELQISPLEYYEVERQLIVSMLSDAQESDHAIPDSILLDLIRRIRNAFFANFEIEGRKPRREHFVFHMFVFTLFMINDRFSTLQRREIILAFFCAVVDALTDFRRGRSDGTKVEPGTTSA